MPTKAGKLLSSILNEELIQIKKNGTFKKERILLSKQSSMITVNPNLVVTNFCANNYLGLSSHPQVIEEAVNNLRYYGSGLSSVRFICGTTDLHKKLETKLSEFHEMEDTILYPSCFDANGGLFEAILTDQDYVFSDQLNHASIIDGIRLCKAQKKRYLHHDMIHLESLLQEAEGARMKLIVSDGVFSMDGEFANLEQMIKLADKYNALIFLDECHATGVVGKSGKGTEEHFGLKGHVDIINSTLGKALGGAAGGYTTSSKEVIQILRQKSRPYLFSNSLPASIVSSGYTAITLLEKSTNLLKTLMENTKMFRNEMMAAGFVIKGDDHPICPVMIGNASIATEMANELLEKGIYVIGFSFPVVPKDQARIRVQISAMHTSEQIKHAIKSFIDLGKKYNIIKK